MSKCIEQTVLKNIDGQQLHEEMFNILNYKRNANKTLKSQLTPERMTSIKKTNSKCWPG
jgi:hypothetical protein